MTKMIMTQPKQFGPEQNNLYTYKTIWTVQNLFGPIEGQGVRGEVQYSDLAVFRGWSQSEHLSEKTHLEEVRKEIRSTLLLDLLIAI